MPRTRLPYPPEFREQMVALVRGGRSPESLSKEFEPTAQTIRNWVARADLDDGVRSDGLTSTERDELRRLKRENRELKLERDILKKAAAWFARESSSIPGSGSEFVKRYQAEFPVATMCRVLGISSCGYYAWLGRGPSARDVANAALLDRIREIHAF